MHAKESSAAGERPIGILVALREEMKAVRSFLDRPRRISLPEGAFIAGEAGGHPVAAALSGMGAANARRAGLFLIHKARPRLLIAAGFAGAADASLRSGDIVIADPLLDLPPPDGEGPRRIPPDPEVLGIAAGIPAAGGAVRAGPLATLKRVAVTASEKRRLSEVHQVIAVDMESLGAARAANVGDLPFLCVRAVIDEAGADLPLDFNALLTADHRPRYLASLAAVLRRPRSLAGLADLQGRSRTARIRLAAYLADLVPALAGLPARQEGS